MTEHVKIEIADDVITLTLRRPEKKNALTGSMYDALSNALKQAEADTSLACGLANAVVPKDELRKRAHDAAIALTRRPAGSLILTKKLMRDHQRIAAQIAEEGQLFKERLKTPGAREAFAAFAEHRSPDFTKVA